MGLYSKRLGGWICFCSVILLGNSFSAMAAEPLARIRQSVQEVFAVLSNDALTPQESQRQVRHIVLQHFAFQETAKRSMAQHWHDLSSQQQREFSKIFTELLLQSYIEKITDFNKNKQKIEFSGEDVDGRYASVYSQTISAPHPSHDIKYRLLHMQRGWQVYDIVIDGISLINNYRIQFDKIIYEDSYKGLLGKMQSKLEQMPSPSQDSSSSP